MMVLKALNKDDKLLGFAYEERAGEDLFTILRFNEMLPYDDSPQLDERIHIEDILDHIGKHFPEAVVVKFYTGCGPDQVCIGICPAQFLRR